MTTRATRSTISVLLAVILLMLLGTQAAALTLSGTIYGGGNPLANALVTLVNATTSAQIGSTSASSTGTYSFTVASGTYNLTVSPPTGSGFSQSVVNGISVTSSDVTQNVILVQAAMTVSGTVRGFGGAAVPSLKVYLYNSATGTEAATATTGSGGQFSLSVPAGTYNLYIQNSSWASSQLVPRYFGYYPQTNLTVSSSVTLPDITVPAVAVSGKTVDGSGTPVSSSTVTNANRSGLAGSGYTYSNSAVSNAQGDYSILVLAGTGYSFTIDPPANGSLARTIISGVDASTNITKNMVIAPAVNVSGTVRGVGGAVVPNLRLYLSDPATGAEAAFAYTGASGQFTLPVPAGTYNLHIQNSNWASSQLVPKYFGYYAQMNLFVTGNTTLADITVPVVTISGKTIDGTGNPVPGVTVSNGNRSGLANSGYTYNASVVSNSQGDYSILVLSGTGYSFTLDPQTGSIFARTVITGVDATTSVTKNLTLNGAITVSGFVRGLGGAVAPNVKLYLYDAATGAEAASGSSGASGQYTLPVPAGTYNLYVQNVGTASSQLVPRYFGLYARTGVVVAAPVALPDINIPAVAVTGKTTDSNGAPIAGVTVANGSRSGLANSGYTSSTSVTSNAQGDYSILVLSGTGYDFTIDPPSGSGFARTLVKNVNLTGSISQGIILNIPDTTPPAITSGPLVSSVTATSAVVEWQASEPVTGSLSYGTTDPPATAIAVTTPRSAHSQILSGLSPDTLYYLTVDAIDIAGNGPIHSATTTFRTKSGADQAPPNFLEGPAVTSVTSTSATVVWTTDEPSTGNVFYGTTSPPATVKADTALTTGHKVALTGLNANTLYYVKLEAKDALGNGPTVSGIISFKTSGTGADVTPPAIVEGPVAIDVSDSEATIFWKTDESGTSGVSYNDGTAYGVASDNTFVTVHTIRLTGLKPSTTYTYTVSSKDAAGNGPTLSGVATFVTTATPDHEPPVIIERSVVVDVTQTTADIYWRTDESSNSVVEFGLDETLGSTASKPDLVTSHAVSLVGLEPGTLYYFRVKSTDASGNGPTTSAILTFKTVGADKALQFTAWPKVEYVSYDRATISWETNNQADSAIDYWRTTTDVQRITDAKREKKHQMTIGNLASGTTYTASVISSDKNGSTIKGLVRFTTLVPPDTVPPQIIDGPVAIGITDSKASIKWRTDKAADSRVNYGVQGTALINVETESKYHVEHVVVLTNLLPGTTYAYTVTSVDPKQNKVTSSVYYFTTKGASDTTGPQITAGPTVTVQSNTQAVVTWTTGEPATTQAEYGTASTALDQQTALPGLSEEHSITLTGLTPSTTYYVKVTSADPSGNPTDSNIVSFQTFAAPVYWTVTPTAFTGGSITPGSPAQVADGSTATFQIATTDTSAVYLVNGCNGVLVDNTYTTGPVHANCTITVTIQPPTTVTLASSVASPQIVGTPITFTAAGSGGSGNYEYQFWVHNGTAWTMVRDYSSTNTWSWVTTGIQTATYTIQANVRNAGSTRTYDGTVTKVFTISPVPKATVAVSSSVASPQIVGSTITFTATGSAGSGTYEYQFWLGTPGANGTTWTKLQDYSGINTYQWNTTGVTPAAYTIQVNIRDAGSVSAYDGVATVAYTITLPPKPAITIAATPASPQVVGTTVTFTATGSGGTGTFEYQFWLYNGSTWTMVQDYGSTNTWTWNTAGVAIKTYSIQANIRNVGSTASLDASATMPFTISLPPKPAISLASSVASPQVIGTPVTFTATGSGGTGTFEFQFWLYNGSTWTMVQDYGSSNTWTWTTTGLTAKAYSVQANIRNVGSTSTFDSSAALAYTLADPPKPPAPTVTLSSDVASPQNQGTKITFTATGAGGSGNLEYQFWLGTPAGTGTTWKMVKDYSAANTWQWDTAGIVTQAYTIQVDVRNVGSTSAYDAAVTVSYTIQTPPKPTITVTPSVASPQVAGTQVTFTATGAGGTGSYQYQFWYHNGTTWTMVQDYSATNTWTWNTTGLAVKTYTIQVDIRNAGSTSAYDAAVTVSFAIALPPKPTVTLAPSAASPQPAGTQVTFTATGAGGTGSYEYQFWLYNGTAWTMVQDYGSANTWAWNTTTQAAKTYTVQANVRNVGSTSAFDGSTTLSYTLAQPPKPTLTVTPSVASPQVAGTQVTFTGTGAGGTGSYQFQFWLNNGSTWTMVQDYSATNTWTWNTTGLAAKAYSIQVNIRNTGSTSAYDAATTLSYTIALPPKPTVTLSASPVSPQPAGTQVTFTATGAGGSGSYQYQFWLNNGTAWTLVQDYGAANTWTWNTTGLAVKSYTIQANIRNTGSTAAFDGSSIASYSISTPPTPTVSVTPSVASPQVAGTSVTFTATGAGGTGSYQYQFWFYNGSAWTMVQDYGAANTWTWNTTGLAAKTYTLQTNIRNVGSTSALDASAITSYTIALPPKPPAPTITLTSSVPSPQAASTVITFTANGAGGTGSLEYQFWLYNGSSWTMVKDYSSTNTWQWNTSGYAARTYTLQANVRNVGSTASYDAMTTAYYAILDPPRPTVTVTPSVPSPQFSGTAVTFTATGAGGTGNYQYQFWLNNGTSWTMVQDYGSANTWTWNTAGLPAKTYTLQVDIRNVGSTSAYDGAVVSTYVLK